MMNFTLWLFFGTIVITLVVFILLIRFLKRLKRREEFPLDREEIERKLKEVEKLLERKEEMSCKLAVLEIDKLLDYILKNMGFGGSSLGERLKVAQYKFPALRNVWWAHKIRNQIVHESDYKINYHLAKKVVKTYKKAFLELGAI